MNRHIFRPPIAAAVLILALATAATAQPTPVWMTQTNFNGFSDTWIGAELTPDGGLLQLGWNQVPLNESATRVRKLDDDYQEEWVRELGYSSSPDYTMLAVHGDHFWVQTRNNGYFITQYDHFGNALWTESFDDIPGIPYVTAMAPLSDGSLLVPVHADVVGEPPAVYLTRYSPTGAVIWQSYFTTPPVGWEEYTSSIVCGPLANDRVCVVYHAHDDLYVRTFNATTGDTLTSTRVTPTNELDLYQTEGLVTEQPAGVVLSDGETLVQLDDTGTILWEQEYPDALVTHTHDITRLADGNLLIVGYRYHYQPTFWNPALMVVDPTGSLVWEQAVTLFDGRFRGCTERSPGIYVLSGEKDLSPNAGDRAIMGVLGEPQPPAQLEVTVNGLGTPIIPPGGAMVNYNVMISNPADVAVPAYITRYAVLPNGNELPMLSGPFTIPPDGINQVLSQGVPAAAPSGNYALVVVIGSNPFTPINLGAAIWQKQTE